MKNKERLYKFLSVIFWLAVWYLAAVLINKKIILVTPAEALTALCKRAVTADFWKTIGYSAVRIIGGFMTSLLTGTLLAALSAAARPVRYLLEPLISAIKSVPVASFIILALFWMPSRYLSVFISFLTVLPVIYTNVLEGISSVDGGMREMAEIFRIPVKKRILYIYIPSVMPFLESGCRISLGMCWKSGVAAEVIGQPDGSLGEALYKSKIYLETADLFAWTAVIILISFLFERIFMHILRVIDKKIAEN